MDSWKCQASEHNDGEPPRKDIAMNRPTAAVPMLEGLSIPLVAYVFLRVWAALAINLHATMAPGVDDAHLAPLVLGLWMAGRLAVDVAGSFLGPKIRSAADRTALASSALVLLELGTLLVTCSANGWLGGLPLLLGGGLVCGIGTEVLALLWLEAVSLECFAVARKLILLDMAVEAVASFACLATFELNLVLCLLLPAGSFLGYRRVLSQGDITPSDAPQETFRLSTKTMVPVGVGIALLFFGSHFLQNA